MWYFEIRLLFQIEPCHVWAYIKSASFVLFVLYIGNNVLSNIFQVMANFWLRDWTNSNIGVTNSTIGPEKGMIVYASLGVGQSKAN